VEAASDATGRPNVTSGKKSTRLPAAPADAEAVERAFERFRPALLAGLREAVEARPAPPFPQMRYHFGWEDTAGRPEEARGGKLLRPTLCLAACESLGGDAEAALPAAVAIELLHNFSLIHDDVEDESAKRHGRATLWTLWGVAEAINVGDAMFALAHATALRLAERGHAAERVVEAVRLLDEASLRLCEGQHRDLTGASVSRGEYLAMVEGKTAALLGAACAIGALLGGGDEAAVRAFAGFGWELGLAFQIRDDVLGIWGDPARTGKPASDDLRAAKRSYPVVLALERAGTGQQAALRELLGRGALEDTEIERARGLLEALDTRAASDADALDHAHAAIATIEGLELASGPRRELEALARFAAERDA
jgi:geranylgeranyl diphosphate synthase type I